MSAVTKHDATGQTVPADQSSIDPVQVYRVVAELALMLHPQATGCKIVIVCPNVTDPTTLNVPLTVHDGDDLESRIEAFFRDKIRPGEWVKGRSVAIELDVDPDGGHFRSTMARMARPGGRLQSHKTQGYRLTTG
jgi:hypothetical protein